MSALIDRPRARGITLSSNSIVHPQQTHYVHRERGSPAPVKEARKFFGLYSLAAVVAAFQQSCSAAKPSKCSRTPRFQFSSVADCKLHRQEWHANKS
jgi:hypothetical protein